MAMSVFKRLMSSKQTFSSKAPLERAAPVFDLVPARSAASDINIKHALAVQRYARAPYHLKTHSVVVSHNDGFLATLEWRWKDPNRDGRTIVAVTSGIHAKRKLAISESFRAMLNQQKLLDDSETAQKEAVVEITELMKEGHYAHACKALLQSSLHASLPLSSVVGLFPQLWRNSIASHDHRLADILISVLEKAEGGVPVTLYEYLMQELVYLSNHAFAERTLMTLSSDRVKLAVPERGLLACGDNTSMPEVDRWKFWRSLIAIEELSNIHTALTARETSTSFRLAVDTVTVPIVKLYGWARDSSLPGGIPLDSLVLLSSPTKSDIGLTGKVTECVYRPDGNAVVTVSLLTEESKCKDNGFLFTGAEMDLIILAESRVTFDRIANCLREFYRVSAVPDMSYRFMPGLRKLILQRSGDEWRPSRREISTPPTLTKEKRFLNLSEVQLGAVTQALTQPVTLIHGPPGAGKTHTLCGIISAWRDNTQDKILACADSNTATDNIYNALKRRGIPAFRLGTWKALTEMSQDVLSALPNQALAEKYNQAVSAYNADPVKHKGYLVGVRKQIEEEAVKHFRIVVTTLSSSRNSILDKLVFSSVIIDESAQQVEPATLLAVSHGCDRLVLIGDHKQLPAVVLSKEAVKGGLNVSLFERLMPLCSDSVLLNMQRRMHPSIAEWPNRTFYDGQIESHESLSAASMDGSVVANFPWFTETNRVVLIDTDGISGGEELVGTSTRNAGECTVLADVVQQLLKNKVAPHQIGVIVPYLAQKSLLLSELRFRRLADMPIQMNTVEGFQGHEKDFIIISTTRSNVGGFLGFLEDDRRMNVMLTRARKGLVVVGDKQTLRKKAGSRWAEWVQWCEDRGAVVSLHQFNNHVRLLS